MRDASTIIPIQTVILAFLGCVVILGIARDIWNDKEDR